MSTTLNYDIPFTLYRTPRQIKPMKSFEGSVKAIVSFPVKRTVRKETGRPLNASAET